MILDLLFAVIVAVPLCLAMSFAVGYLGCASGFWTWTRRRLSCVDYDDLTPSLYSSDGEKTSRRRGRDWL